MMAFGTLLNKSSCILAGARTLAGALVPLKGTAPTNNGFLSADYNRATGLKVNGSSKYLNSNRADNADPIGNHHIAVYHTDINAYNGAAQSLIGSRNVSSNSSSSFEITGTGTQLFTSRSSSSVTNNNAGNALIFFKGVSRTSTSSINWYFHPTNINGINFSSTASIGSQNVFVFAFNTDGTISKYSLARITFYSIGESLNLTLLANRVSALMSAYSTLT